MSSSIFPLVVGYLHAWVCSSMANVGHRALYPTVNHSEFSLFYCTQVNTLNSRQKGWGWGLHLTLCIITSPTFLEHFPHFSPHFRFLQHAWWSNSFLCKLFFFFFPYYKSQASIGLKCGKFIRKVHYHVRRFNAS